MGAGNSTQRSSQKQETKTLTISEMLRSVVDSIVLMSDNASPPSVDNLHFTSLHVTSLHNTDCTVLERAQRQKNKKNSPQARKYSFVVYISW